MRKTPAPTPRRLALTLALIALTAPVAHVHEGFYEGFGAVTRGAADCPTGFTIHRVTSLGDNGAGTLRDAVSQACRYVVFDVGGTITLGSTLTISDSYLTIDGASAPAPGITIDHPTIDEGVVIESRLSVGPVHDVIVHNLTHTGPGGHDDTSSDIWGLDGSAHPVYNIILHHITASGANDGIFDMSGEVHDVTVSWNLIFGTETASSVTGGIGRKWNISVHHNVFAQNQERQVKVRGDAEVDYVNNVVYGWGWQGCSARGLQIDSVDPIDPRINAEHNVFHHVTSGVSCIDGNGGIVFQNGVGGSQAYFNGNIVPPTETNGISTALRLPIPPSAEVMKYAANALGDVMVSCVGSRHGTASEQALLQQISVAIGGSGGPCPAFTMPPGSPDPVVFPDLVEPAVTDPPSMVVLGDSFPVTDTVLNLGTSPSGAFTIGYHLASAPSTSILKWRCNTVRLAVESSPVSRATEEAPHAVPTSASDPGLVAGETSRIGGALRFAYECCPPRRARPHLDGVRGGSIGIRHRPRAAAVAADGRTMPRQGVAVRGRRGLGRPARSRPAAETVGGGSRLGRRSRVPQAEGDGLPRRSVDHAALGAAHSSALCRRRPCGPRPDRPRHRLQTVARGRRSAA
jgi:pectate lyase